MSLVHDLWNGSTDYKFIIAVAGKRIKHIKVSSADQAAEAARTLSENKVDVYFAPSAFDPDAVRRLQNTTNPRTGRRFTGRAQEAVASVGGFWLDIDCGEGTPYKSWLHGLVALLRWCKEQQFYRPSYIIRSGGGLHIYWLLEAAVPHEVWKPVAQHFKQALAIAGVHADPSRTADSASMLRVPGTMNWKRPDEPRPVEELFGDGRRLALEDFQARLPKVGPIRTIAPTADADDEWGIATNYPPGDAEDIASGCAQVREVRDKRGAVPEPLWRAGLSVLWRCADREHYIHEWSQGDPRYDAHETQQKAEATGGPATCQHFSDVNPGGCVGCPHAGKITSPIQIAVAPATTTPEPAPEAAPDETADPDFRPTQVGAFRISDAGVYFQPPATADDPAPAMVRVTEVPLWVMEVREKARLDSEQGASYLFLEWRTVDNRTRRALLPQAVLHEPRAIKAWLADHNIISAVYEVNLLVAFINKYTLQMLKKRGSREYHENLGWYEGGFVVGEQIIGADGPRPALVQSSNPIAKIKARGSVEGWKKATAIFSRPEYRKHAFALLCGFASPVLALADVQSAVVSLVGTSGAGKTLAARAALSIYGQPGLLMQGAPAGVGAALEKQLTVNRHAPFLLDEVTQFPAQRLGDFIYLAANGEGKSVLTRNRENREKGEWKLVPFITSNRPVLEFHQRDIQEAHRRRLLEVHFETVMDLETGRAISEGIEANAGAVGGVYLQQLAKARKEIPALFEQAERALAKRGLLPDANRFGLWTLAAAIVGGSIAKAMGLIDFSPMEVIEDVLQQSGAHMEDVKSEPERAADALREWLARESKRVSHWEQGGVNVDELVDDPIARNFKDGTMAVHKRLFSDMLLEENISRAGLKHWFKKIATDERTVRLAPGTPGVWCLLIDLEAAGVEL